MRKKKILSLLMSLILIMGVLSGCSLSGTQETEPVQAAPYDGSEYIRMSELTDAAADPEAAAAEYETEKNYDTRLSVPTYVTEVDGVWFIVDCYHNRIICTDTMGIPLDQWNIMCKEVTYPHTLASDGRVYLVDDTENSRVLVFEKQDDKFLMTQVFYDIGIRPHFSAYDEISDTFYVWSSESGELYCFRHTADSTRMYLTDVRKVEQLANIYVRSFTIIDGDIYFVSGVSQAGAKPQILVCDLDTLAVKKTYDVPDEMAGMVQITPIDGEYYITISTDITGNQDYATIIRTGSLADLTKGKYEDIYAKYFVGGGTPYNISKVGDTYYLTEHRLTDHQIWSFKVEKGEIKDVTAVY